MSRNDRNPKPQDTTKLRSCDSCRKKRVRFRCGPRIDGSCASCLEFGTSCAYLQPSKKRGPKDRNVRLEELRRANAALEAKLRSLSICSLCAQPLRSLSQDGASTPNLSVSHSASTPGNEPEEVKREEDTLDEELAHRVSQMSIDLKYVSSGNHIAFVNTAIAAKEKYFGPPPREPWQLRRTLYREILPWEKVAYDREPQYVYPEKDLISSLLRLYFTHVHPFLPFLHRPSFERSVAEGLHLRDSRFGSTLLSVLAVASRYSDDPRVFIDGHSTLSSGWTFIDQVQVVRKGFLPNIYEVQFYLLMSIYSIGTSAPQASWLYQKLAIQFLRQHSEHRRKREINTLDHETELWSRAFWLTAFFLQGGLLRRGNDVCVYRAANCASFPGSDSDLPIEVDDEFWDQGFVQPSERPSFQVYFTHYIRICEILGDALHSLYGSKKKKRWLGCSPEWEQRAVAELDSAMNECFASIPPHLHWNPHKSPQDATFDQSFSLYAVGRYTEIVVHRPHIHKQNISTGASLVICASAARAIIHATDAWTRIRQCQIPQLVAGPVFVSAIVLTMNTFGDKRAGRIVNKDNALVIKAMQILKSTGSRFLSLGRLSELLVRLCSLDVTQEELSRSARESAHTATTGAWEPDMLSKNRSSASISFPQTFSDPSEHQKPFDSENPAWSADWISSEAGEQYDYSLKPGMSIEELLAGAGKLAPTPSLVGNNFPGRVVDDRMISDDELVSMWMAAPPDFSDAEQWGAYLQRQRTCYSGQRQ